MPKYIVEVVQTSSGQVEVDANSPAEALSKVNCIYFPLPKLMPVDYDIHVIDEEGNIIASTDEDYGTQEEEEKGKDFLPTTAAHLGEGACASECQKRQETQEAGGQV